MKILCKNKPICLTSMKADCQIYGADNQIT